jgi:anti-anti-sigma factor
VVKFSLSSKAERDVAIMTPKGYLADLGAHRIEKVSERFLDKGFKKFIINFSNVEVINSVGISILVSVLQKTSESSCRVCFTEVSKLHRDIFKMTGLIKYIEVFRDDDTAMVSLNGKA